MEKGQQKNPDMKSLEQVGRGLLGVALRANQQNDRLANKILLQLSTQGKKSRLERYVNQMSQEERKYVSLVSILEEFRPVNLDS